MGAIHSARPVKMFAGVITSAPESLNSLVGRLAAEFGPVDLHSDVFPFDSTRYYDAEMGTPLVRFFCSFERLIEGESIAAVKIRTNEIEAELASGAAAVRRPANIDPGYLEESKIVLASTKNFYHRIIVARGIYAEVTMHYEGRQWQNLPWTFPDFRTGRYHPFFTRLREIYRSQLRSRVE